MEATLEKRIDVLKIPLDQIKPNPDNPRHVITPEMVENLAASIQSVGLNNALKVEALPEGGYRLLSGHLRFAALQKLGWAEAPAQVLDLTPARAHLEATLDNQGHPMHWLDWDIAVETQKKLSGANQTDLAAEFGVSQTKINWALKVAGALNQGAREAIYYTVINPTPDYEVTERPVLLLADLNKPELVEKAVTALIQHRLTLSQVPKLVEWVEAGNKPEDFSPVKPPRAKRKPKGSVGSSAGANGPKVALQSPAQPISREQAKSGTGVAGTRAGGQPQVGQPSTEAEAASANDSGYHSKVNAAGSPMEPAQPTRGPQHEASAQAPDLHTQIGSMIAGNELAKKLHLPKQLTNRLFPTFTHLFQRVIGLFEWMGVKNRVVATFLALLLVLFVGSSLISHGKRLMRWMVYSMVYSRPTSALRSQTEGQALIVPIPRKEGIGAVSSSNPPAVNPSNPAPAAQVTGDVNPTAQAQVAGQSPAQPVKAEVPKPAVNTTNSKSRASSASVTQATAQKNGADSPSESAHPNRGSQPDASTQGDPLKAVGDAVNGLSNAVNTAKKGESAVDTAKNLFGL